MNLRTRLIILTVVSAVISAFAQPCDLFPYGNIVLGLFSLVPFLWAIIKSPSYRFASLLGVIFAFVFNVLSNYWLLYFMDYSVWTLSGVVIGYMLYFFIFSKYLRFFSLRFPQHRPLLIAVAWTLYEFFKCNGFLAYPWGLSFYPFNIVIPFIQFADVSGIYGLSFVAVLLNSLIAEYFLKNEFNLSFEFWKRFTFKKLFSLSYLRSWLFFLFLVVLFFSYGFARLAIEVPVKTTAKMLLIQHNGDPWEEGRENLLKHTTNCVKLSVQGLQEARSKAEKVDLVVWSETALPLDYTRFSDYCEGFPPEMPLNPVIRDSDSYFLFGAPVKAKGQEQGKRQKNKPTRPGTLNAAVLVAPDTSVLDYYGKQHPVPLAEAIPFWDFPPIKVFFSSLGLTAGWTMGDRYTVFQFPLHNGDNLSFGAPVCFEDAFSDLCRQFILKGADMWINQTNDSWSKTVFAETQHFVAARFRSIENRRTMVRCTNGGFSCVIDAHGRVIDELPYFEEAYLLTDVPIFKEEGFTFYTLVGDWLPLVFAIILLTLIIRNMIFIKKFL